MSKIPSYSYLTVQEWDEKISLLDSFAQSCRLCPHMCGVDRLQGKNGFCKAPGEMIISSIFPHHGEEPPISGTRGSGTVFFTYCTCRCVFCQNYQISHDGEGRPYSPEELASEMLGLQEKGCHNVNLVTATHYLPWVVRSLNIASSKGLKIPVVYNCGGYESDSVISVLNGIVDIYLPDMKYGTDKPAELYSNAKDYVSVNRKAIKEMFRQTGPLKIDNEGIAYRGLCIRHLVLPEGVAGTEDIFDYLISTYDPHDIFISLMAQYKPLNDSSNFPEINSTIEPEYYGALKKKFLDAGFEGFYQEIERMNRAYVIDFKERKDQRLIDEND